MHLKRALLPLLFLSIIGLGYVYLPTLLLRPTTPPQNEVVNLELEEKSLTLLAEGLEIPWEIAFLPDGDFLITERPGTLRRLGSNAHTYTFEHVYQGGEGGLLGMTLHPSFPSNPYLYLYFTVGSSSGTFNKVVRYRYEDAELVEDLVIIDQIPGAIYHDGGRMRFGPDGKLYITTGDATNPQLAQDPDSLAGKILRLNDDGSIPEDNPFGSAVFSLGHRNPQGLSWDENGRLWSSEHGRSGIKSGMDEVNLIEAGQNYGWPTVEGDESTDVLLAPYVHSGPDHTWAPSDLEFIGDRLFFPGLRGEALYEVVFDEEPRVQSFFFLMFGRIRVARLGPDGFLYFMTSNRDGRGIERPRDDKLYRIHPDLLKRQ